MPRIAIILVVLAATGCAEATEANPIRKVVTMMQMMQNKVVAEGKRAEGLFDRFMCYCETGEASLKKSISDAEAKLTALGSSIGSTAALKAQLESDIKEAKANRAAAEEDIEAATGQRNKEHVRYAKVSSDLAANVGAIAAIEKGMAGGMAGGFLQAKSASVLRRLSVQMEMSSVDRDTLASFLALDGKDGYVPQSQEILGILKQMHDEMEADLKTENVDEDSSQSSYDGVAAAKNSEIGTLKSEIEEKLTRLANTGVSLAEQENDQVDTTTQLGEDNKFLGDMGTMCANKRAEWDAYKKVQAEELLALADTIKVLNGDDALELFKGALPSAASFLQVQVSAGEVRQRALAALASARTPGHTRHESRLDLVEMALRGKATGFEKVIKMIDNLIALLHREQGDDDAKKAYCEAEFDKSDDTHKAVSKQIADLEAAIADGENNIANLKSEIEALEDSIAALDKSVADATAQRKDEHDAYVEDSTAANTAKDLLNFAKNRLNKFYNPKLYKPPPKRELSEEERVTLNMGGTLAPTAPPAGIAGTGIGLVQVHSAAAVPPPPAANLAYKKSAGGGPIAMIDILVKDLDKQLQEMEVTEKDSQADYEKFMKDSAEDRAEASKSMTDKEASKAAAEDEVLANQGSLKDSRYELMDTEKYISELHGQCDWLVKMYEMRKGARTKEIDALGNAKDVLNGADYSF